MGASLNLAPSVMHLPPMTASPILTIPISIDNQYVWGIHADLAVTAFVSGYEDAPLAVGHAEAFMEPSRVTTFGIELSDAGVSPARADAIRDVLAVCSADPLEWPFRKWFLDLHFEFTGIARIGIDADSWVRHIEVPCAGGVGSAIAASLAKAGARALTLNDTRRATAEALAGRLRRDGGGG